MSRQSKYKTVAEIPELIKEWDKEKNDALGFDPTKITACMNRYVWWICEKGHSYQARVYNRTNHYGCPYCAGKIAITGENDVFTVYPYLKDEWDYENNVGVAPLKLTAGSSAKKYSWICNKGHRWQATIVTRGKRKSGCPYCAGNLPIVGETDLATTNPEAIKIWDYEANNAVGIYPTAVKASSSKTANWVCEQGHKWSNSIANVVAKGEQCPYCVGKRVIEGETDLATTHAYLLSEWDYEKNDAIGIYPTTVSFGSSKKVWWKCKKGHSWCTQINTRARSKCGCPYCSHHYVIVGETDLTTVRPDLVMEWDYTKNVDVTPINVVYGSNKQVWWRCSKCGYSYRATVANRALYNTGCPACINQVLVPGQNDLLSVYPDLASEFNTVRNEMSASEIYCKSTRKVWWVCTHCQKEWQARVSDRATHLHIGCADCNRPFQSSFPERALYYYLKPFHPDVIKNYKFENGLELDIYVPSLQTAIEYDGEAWHTDAVKKHYSYAKDDTKTTYCIEQGITLIRIRESKCPPLTVPCCVYTISSNYQAELSYIIKQVLKEHFQLSNVDVDIVRDQLKIAAQAITCQREQSVAIQYPEIAKTWCVEKNDGLNPYMVGASSSLKVWWHCSECGTDYQLKIRSRIANKYPCPTCYKMTRSSWNKGLKGVVRKSNPTSTRVRRLAIPPQTRSLPK